MSESLTLIIITQSINLDRDEACVLGPLTSVGDADTLLVNLEIRHLATHCLGLIMSVIL